MTNVATTYWQGGLETTPLTAVAATRKIYELGPVPEESRPKEHITQSRNTFIENFEVVETHALVDFSLEAPALSYNDLAWWLELCLKGGISPTGAGPYTRTYASTSTTDDLKAATFEVADEISAFQIPGSKVNTFEFKGKGGVDGAGLVSGKYDLIGQKLTPGHTMTAALSERDLRGTYMPFVQTQFYLDDAAGSIGGTEIGTLMEFSIKGNNKISRLFFGGDSGYAGGLRRNERYLEFMVKLLFDATSYAEFTNKFRANTGRYCQLKHTGAGTDTLTWKFYTKFEKFEYPVDGPVRQVGLLGRTVYDATLGYDWNAVLVNSVASIS